MAGNLPADPTTFLGRERALIEVADLLARSRMVTLKGPGGVGKTRLAVRVAAARGPADGAWLADLAALQDPALLPLTLTELLGGRGEPARPPVEVLADCIGERRLLLILDTCEHLLTPCAEVATVVLSRCPNAHILATSRQPLDVVGEYVYAVPPMGAEAVELFNDRARSVLPGFLPDGQVVEICDRLDGLPLAIELAAACLRSLSLADIAERLNDRFKLLSRSRPRSRHQTMRTAIGWSHELCTPRERLMWARLSVFVGYIDREMAEAVCADDRLSPRDIPPLMGNLVDKSILIREGNRFRMLDSIREYGLEWLRELLEEETICARHHRAYRELVGRAEAAWAGPNQLHWARRLIDELPNLRLAMDNCLRVNPPAALELAGALWLLWNACGYHREGRYYLNQALAANPEHSPLRVKAQWVGAWVDIEHFDAVTAQARIAQCRIEGGDTAYLDHMAGLVDFITGDDASAVGHLERALSRTEELEEYGPGSMLTMAQLGISLARTGDARAEEVLGECLRVCRASGERWARSIAHYGMALLHWERGEVALAEAQNRESLRIKRDYGDVPGAVLGIELQAWFAAETGRGRRAAELLGAVNTLWRSMGMKILHVPFWAQGHRHCEDLTHSLLGEQEFELAFARGAAHDLREAYRHALDETHAIA